MAQGDVLRRYLDTGLALGQLTRERAEEIVKDLVRAGDVQLGQAQEFVEDLLERSRRNAEMLAEVVRGEVRRQLAALNLGRGRSGPKKAAPKAVASKTAAPNKTAAPKKAAPQKTAAPKKAAPKKTAAKKTAAKKAAPGSGA